MKTRLRINRVMQQSQGALLTVAVLLSLAIPCWGDTLPQLENDDAIDFATSILPILQQRCFECHGETKSKGELRLDLESEVLRGGHTGNIILGDNPTESELYLRISSNEDGFRMPKKGTPLSENEVQLFKKWIEQGSEWTDAVAAAKPSQKASSPTTTEHLGNWWSKIDQAMASPSFRYVSFLTIPLLLFVFAIAVSFWDRRKFRKHGKSDRFSLAWFNPTHHLAALLLLLVIAALLFQFGLVKELRSAKATLQAKLDRTKKTLPSADPASLPLPVHPMHPKRLGGVYYRGNDERSPELFNGGFYRTATMEVRLTDAIGKQLQWNDEPTDQPLWITLSIERAAGATSSLFSSRVMSSTFLTHFAQSQLSKALTLTGEEKILLREIEPGQKWEAKIPIASPEDWRDGAAEGLIYVHHGNQVNPEGKKGRIHFGIKYKIQLVDTKISEDSEIWMGSLYNLNGRVLIPDENSILLDRWFDFRPIPEIIGSNSSDPTLLGIPEHVRNE
jgi:hypothetical protein